LNIAMAQSAQLSSQNPWPGLRAFTENDRDFFFGRERETSELLELVQRSSVVVLYGQSGLGKTSLLQAGLLPDLKRADFLPLRVRFDHGDDAPPLAQQIENELAAELDRAKSSTPRPAQNETLWEYFHRRDVDFWGPRNRLLTPVIVLDQFEEIFTLGQRNDKSAARVAQFAAELEAVLEHRAPEAVRKRLEANPDDATHYDLDSRHVKFVISLREDFLPDLDPWRARTPSLLANRFRLERMTGAQALDVVELGGRELLDGGAARAIVDFVSKSKREHSSRAMEQRDVEPALLSVVCDELNRRRIDQGKSRITVDLLTDEREEIIRDFYERAFDGADPRVRDWVEDKLLTGSGYRNRAALEDAIKAGLPQSAFDQLVDRRILHREERGGVVWLELTHDLLSDPASQSRTAREQRRVAQAGKQREAELSAQLANSRKQVAVYGTLLAVVVLLIGLAAALSFVTARNRRARLEAEKLGASNSAMVKQLSSQSSEIGGTWVPTQTLLQMINDRNEFFEKGLPQTSSPEELLNLNRAHVNFLTRASEALYDVGRFDESLADTQSALAVLDQESWPASSRDSVRLMRAEALHNQAAGFLATGQLSKAAASYNDALNLLPKASAADLGPGFAHVYVLSQFGLGEVELQSLAQISAAPHFQAALDFANARKGETDDVHWWKALAYEGLALSQWDDAEAEKWYAKASDEAQRLIARDPGNPRWKRLFADIAYRRGFAATGLNQYDKAMSLFEQSQAAAGELVERDPDNRDWQLVMLQAQRGLGVDHYDLGEWTPAQSILEQAEKTAKTLNEGQPMWARAAFLHGLIVETLGDIQQIKFSDSSELTPAQKQASFESASKLFDEAHDILQRSAKTSPDDLEVVRMSIASLTDQGNLREAEAGATRTAAKENKQLRAKADQQEREALAFYTQALGQLQPMENLSKVSTAITSDKAVLQSSIGDVFADLQEPREALSAYKDSAAKREVVAKAQPGADHFDRVSLIHITLGDAYRDEKDFPKAFSEYTLANMAIADALKLEPQSTTFLGSSAFIHSRFADLALTRHDLKTALDEMDTAISTDWAALQYNYADSWLNSNLDAFRTKLDNIEKQIEPDSAASTTTGNTGKPGSSQKANPRAEQATLLMDRIDKLRSDSDPTRLLSHYGQSSAALRPLLPGAWRILTGSEYIAARHQLLAVAKTVESGQIQGIRTLPLDFYEDATLYEAVVKTPDNKDGIVDYVSRGSQRFLVDGSLDLVTRMNKTSPPKLDSPSRAVAYLRFWLGSREPADDGRLLIVEREDDLSWLHSASADQRADIAGKAMPLVLEAGSSGGWNAIGSVELGGELDRASFNISRDGSFVVPRYDQAEASLPISVDVFSDGIRVQETLEDLWKNSIKSHPDDENALRQLTTLYFNAERWKEAADVAQKRVALLQRKSKDNHESADDLPSAYRSLVVAQLYSRDFTGALVNADAWKAIAPDDLQPDRMRAHALLFLDRTQEAEAAYVHNVGKTIGSTSWQNQMAADFKEFEGEKLTSPDFQHILELLALERIRQLKADPNNAADLQALPDAYSELKRWPDAVDAEKNWIVFVERESKNDAERAKTLASAYLALSWYQLFARDFDGALASAEAGQKLGTSENLFLDTNRAHALLFLGRTQEAEAIYLGNRGKKFDPKGDEIWEAAVLDDFNSFDKDGLTNPEIPRIRKLLSPESK
jgi:tetratricopeptide (TPR) repeat protein